MSDVEHTQATPPSAADRPRGVFLVHGGQLVQVHEYLGGGGDYGLDDIAELLGIGAVDRWGEWLRLRLSRRDLNDLRVAAHAYSFDYPAELIEMCLDMVRAVDGVAGETLEFLGNF